MIIVDTALEAREKEGRPIRVALLGAGFMNVWQGLRKRGLVEENALASA